jgi:CRISPR/Cas system-associated endonuclease Cas1
MLSCAATKNSLSEAALHAGSQRLVQTALQVSSVDSITMRNMTTCIAGQLMHQLSAYESPLVFQHDQHPYWGSDGWSMLSEVG